MSTQSVSFMRRTLRGMTTDEISDYLLSVIQKRIDAGELKSDLARKIGTNPTTLGNWLGERKGIPAKQHAKVAARLGLELALVAPSAAARLSKAAAQLSAAQVDDLAALAHRLVIGKTDPAMLGVAVKLLDLDPHHFRAAKAHE